MFSVILLSLLMAPLCILNVIRHQASISLWTWIRSKRDCGLGQELTCSFQCWFHLTSLITLVLLMWKWMCLFLRKNHLLRCWGWLSHLNWIRALKLSLLLKLPPRKLEPWFILWSFFLLRLLYISINLPYSLAWNIVAMSQLVLLVATWICGISYKNGYAGLLVFHSLLLLNPWFIVQM